MKLIISYVVSDGCTYATDIIIPLEYDSAEAALVDFEAAMLRADDFGDFTFCGKVFNNRDFCGYNREEPPDILTVDEWYARRGLSKQPEQQSAIKE